MLTSALIKPPEAIARMREAAAIVAGALEMIVPHVRPGITTARLDRLCHDYIVDHGGVPSCVGYQGYRHASCISVNHVVCHGVPGDQVLRDGDLLNIDLVAAYHGWHADSSAMFIAGQPTVAGARLATLTQQALYLGMLAVRPGARVGDIGAAIQRHAQAHGLSVVRDYGGHGIGREMHEAPEVLHYRTGSGHGSAGITLLPGMTFTIEPMLNAGSHHCRTLADGWTVVTRDRALSAQWEHTVLVTDTGVEPLTLRAAEREHWLAFAQARGGVAGG